MPGPVPTKNRRTTSSLPAMPQVFNLVLQPPEDGIQVVVVDAKIQEPCVARKLTVGQSHGTVRQAANGCTPAENVSDDTAA